MNARLLGLSFFIAAVAAVADVPQTINYQGRLLNGTNLVNGNVELWIRLYTNSAGGVQIYEDTGTVAVVDGLYATRIGDGTSLGSLSSALTNTALYVELVVNSTILSPREPLAAVAYALMADGVRPGGITSPMLANGAISNSALGANAVTSSKIADGSIMDGDLNVAAAITASKIANTALVQTTTFSGDVSGPYNNLQLVAGSVDSNTIHDSGITERDLDIALRSNVFWRMTGNAGTTSGTHFVGTLDARPLELRANNTRVFLASTGGAPSITLGSVENLITNTVLGASILGGSNNTISGASHFAVVGGGRDNELGVGCVGAVIGGGHLNRMTNVWFGTIAGGSSNMIGGYSDNSVISGGSSNLIGGSSFAAVIAGGSGNKIEQDADNSFIAGGRGNEVYSNAYYAFAAGHRAKARHAGTFVWADNTDSDFLSTRTNQFLIRAGNGVGINTTNPIVDFRVNGNTILGTNTFPSILISSNILNLAVGQNTNNAENGITFWEQGSFGMSIGYDGTELSDENRIVIYSDIGKRLFSVENGGNIGIGVDDPTNDIHLAGGAQCNGSTWLNASDRNLKEGFAPVDAAAILDKVEALPISEWSYKLDGTGVRHIGPISQDFYSTFGLGDNDTTISTIDPAGVALAAIQALAKENAELKATVDALKTRLDALENESR